MTASFEQRVDTPSKCEEITGRNVPAGMRRHRHLQSVQSIALYLWHQVQHCGNYRLAFQLQRLARA